jgi:DNA-binding NarL/FixJ family response regulator
LVVEADLEVALTLHRGLYAVAEDFDVLLAGSADVARAIMRDLSVDVLVTDTGLPGMSGVDLACWAAVESPETLLVVMTAEPVSDLQDRMRGLGCLRLLQKPCEVREVVRIVDETLSSRNRLSGSFAALSAADLIQMLCLARRTLSVRISANGMTGGLAIVDGQLVHATWGNLVGERAMREIIAVEDGVFRTAPILSRVEPTIERDWQHVLMDAVRALDELAHGTYRSSGALPAIRMDDVPLEGMLPRSANRRLSPSPENIGEARFVPRAPSAASALVDKGFAALRAGNLDEARQCWQAAKQMDPDNRSLDLNLRKLESMTTREGEND